MASRIAGITIDIDADASKFQAQIKNIDKELKGTKSTLKDVDKLLKLDPSNTELLRQKQKALKEAIAQTKDRLQALKDEQKNLKEGTPEWEALQREIVATEQDLRRLQQEQRNFGNVASQQLKVAGQKMKEFGGKVEEVGKKLSKISGVATGALAAIGKLGYDTMQTADELDTLSAKTGVSTDELQKWQYASELVDVDMSTITSSLTKMKKNMSGNADAFEALGVSVTDADGNFRNVTDVFYDTVAALSNIDNETERDIKAMEIFGKGADDLAGIIDDGGAALKAYGQEAEDLGLIMGGDTIDALNEANDTVDKLKGNMKGSFAQAGATLVTTFAPALEKVAEVIGKVTEKIRNLSPEQAEMIVKILGVIAVVGPLVLTIGKIISGIGSVISIIGTVVGVLGGPLTLIIAGVIALAALVIANWDWVKEKALAIASAVVSAWNSLKAGVSAAASAVADWVVNAWNTAKSGVTTAVNSLKSVVTTVWNGIKTAVSTVVDGVKSKIQSMIDKFNSARDAIKGAIDKIKSILSGELKFPHIKIPHFNISGGVLPWGIGGQGTPPKVTVDWYKQAYNNPVMFTQPTVLQTPSGYKGFGDGSGAEIVLGLDKLRELVSSGQNVNVNVYLQGDAKGMFKVIRQTNNSRARATNYNALSPAVGG